VQDRICREFDVEPELAYVEAVEFVEQLARHGILVVCDQPIISARVTGSTSS
jgi:hypothetical protein